MEDTRAARLLMKQLLEVMRDLVTVAVDGIDGREKAVDSTPDVIVSDISMPRMNGLRLAEMIRKGRSFDRTLLVALTAYGRSEDRQQALAAGFNRHLTKPIDATSLAAVLAEYHQSIGN